MAPKTKGQTNPVAPRKSRISEFSSVEKEAEFWDTHDVTDFWDEMTPVKVRFAKNLSQGMTIRLDLDTTIKLKSEAAKKGIGATTLVRMWVLERLKEQAAEKGRGRSRPTTPARRRRAG
jgi:predicted DNA binding CopG/RHH family protein